MPLVFYLSYKQTKKTRPKISKETSFYTQNYTGPDFR